MPVILFVEVTRDTYYSFVTVTEENIYWMYCHFEFVIFIPELYKYFNLFSDVECVISCNGKCPIILYYLPFYFCKTKHPKHTAPCAPQCNLLNYIFIYFCNLYLAMYFTGVYLSIKFKSKITNDQLLVMLGMLGMNKKCLALSQNDYCARVERNPYRMTVVQ
jgi:hypothetical protein